MGFLQAHLVRSFFSGSFVNAVVRIGLILFLVIFQTTIYYAIPAMGHFVNLLITFVIYAGLFLPFVESIVLAIVLGLLSWTVSQGARRPVSVRIFLDNYRAEAVCDAVNLTNANTLRLLLGIAIGFENLMLFAGTVALKQQIAFSSEAFWAMACQLFWTLLLGPVFIRLLKAVDRYFKVHAQLK